MATRYNHAGGATHYFDSTAVTTLLMNMQIPKEDFDYSLRAAFEDIELPIPSGADEVLRIRYGDYMKLPSEEEQKPHFGLDYITPQSFRFEDTP